MQALFPLGALTSCDASSASRRESIDTTSYASALATLLKNQLHTAAGASMICSLWRCDRTDYSVFRARYHALKTNPSHPPPSPRSIIESHTQHGSEDDIFHPE